MANIERQLLPERRKGGEEVHILKLLKDNRFTYAELCAVIEGIRGLIETQRAIRATLECEPEKRVSFAEAVQLLDSKLDLEAARLDAVKAHRRFGLVGALVEDGVIADASRYGALFDEVTIGMADLLRVRESLECGERILPIFDPGNMTPGKLFDVLFEKGGVPNNNNGNSYGFKDRDLAKLRRVKSADIPDLASLADKSSGDKFVAFNTAYRKADPMEQITGPRVLFTPDEYEVTYTGKTIIEDMQAVARGEVSFLDPNADFLRFRAQMDRGFRRYAESIGCSNFDDMTDEVCRVLVTQVFKENCARRYAPDCMGNTRYPNYVFENGWNLAFGFSMETCAVIVSRCAPGDNGSHQGSRISLG